MDDQEFEDDSEESEVTDDFDITPEPNILIALTFNPLSWLDALCELIDNGIDSFAHAQVMGEPIENPLVELFIPPMSEVNRGEGTFLIRDNGPGLDRAGLMKALRAGYSTNNRYGRLGLFGVGLNIATGKIGRRTVVTTARAQDDFAIQATLDLPELAAQRSFKPPNKKVPKPEGMDHGTRIEVSGWWPPGHGNANFVKTIASKPQKSVLDNLGRRYATLLRGDVGRVPVRMEVYPSTGSDPDPVVAFEHCIWGEERFVIDGRFGFVPAQIHFDEVIGATRRCAKDSSAVPTPANYCPQCNGQEFVTIEERVRGWVGIQRFDDTNNFGVDVIRNGRAILTGEQDAFFSREDDLGVRTREYPVDDQTGRIVGEVHLDHVPVDFLKQRFERDPTWTNAMEFIRGLSLMPTQWADAYVNESPISKLNQAYKRVRDYGRRAMYMGVWDPTKRKAVRISREVERDYYKRFLAREPGYYDDAEWWKHVEGADTPPPPLRVECETCHYQNLVDAAECDGCGALLQSKPCVSCAEDIPLLATSCPECGEDQARGSPVPWNCQFCGYTNSAEDLGCGQCALAIDAPHPASREALARLSQLDDELTKSGCRILLANGAQSDPLDIKVWGCSTELKPTWDGPAVPLVLFKEPGVVEIFLDPTHPVFGDLQVKPVELVATEAALYLYELNRSLIGHKGHTISALTARILEGLWGDDLSAGPEAVKAGIMAFFDAVAERLRGCSEATDFYLDLRETQQQELATGIVNAGRMGDLTELLDSGGYLAYMPRRYFVDFFNNSPDAWFEHVWLVSLPDPDLVGNEVARRQRQAEVDFIGRCLGDCAALLGVGDAPAAEAIGRAHSALESLEGRLR